MNDTTKAPHCPRCGGEMVHQVSATRQDVHGDLYSRAGYQVGCHDCGFAQDAPTAIQPVQKSAERIARRLVRAELARQALEMRAHSAATQNTAHGCSLFTLSETILMVTNDYEWLGTHPLRLPEEEA